MALFFSSCNIQIIRPKPQINYAIQRTFTSKTSISKTTDSSEATKVSISIPGKFSSESLSFPDELDNGAPSNLIIFIKGLAQSTSEGALMTVFSQFGEVNRVNVVRDKKTKQSLGFAYVWFVKEEHARAAVGEMNGEFFEGRFVHVSLAKPESCKARPKHSRYKF